MRPIETWLRATQAALLIAALTLTSSVAFANDCESSEDNLWLCKDDPAWADGYLVSPKRLEELLDAEGFLDRVKEERDAFRRLVESYRKQRDEYREIKDALTDLLQTSMEVQETYRMQRESIEAELVIVEEKYLEQHRHAAKLEADLNGAWAPWEVGLLVGGVSALSILAGVGATLLYVNFK